MPPRIGRLRYEIRVSAVCGDAAVCIWCDEFSAHLKCVMQTARYEIKRDPAVGVAANLSVSFDNFALSCFIKLLADSEVVAYFRPMARGRKPKSPVTTPRHMPPLEVWRVAQVEAFTGLKRRTLQGMAVTGDFPRARALGKRTIFWLRSEVEAWVLSRPYVP